MRFGYVRALVCVTGIRSHQHLATLYILREACGVLFSLLDMLLLGLTEANTV